MKKGTVLDTCQSPMMSAIGTQILLTAFLSFIIRRPAGRFFDGSSTVHMCKPSRMSLVQNPRLCANRRLPALQPKPQKFGLHQSAMFILYGNPGQMKLTVTFRYFANLMLGRVSSISTDSMASNQQPRCRKWVPGGASYAICFQES